MNRSTVVVASVFLLAACSAEETSPEVPAATTEAVATEQATPEVEASPTSDPVMVSQVTMLDPADEDGFLNGVAQREPDRMTQFDQDELVELGVVVCNATVDYVNGSSPTPGDELLAAMIDRGHDSELSEEIAPAIRNSARGTLCDVEVVEHG